MEKVTIDPRVGGGFEIVEPRDWPTMLAASRRSIADHRTGFLFRATMDGKGGGRRRLDARDD